MNDRNPPKINGSISDHFCMFHTKTKQGLGPRAFGVCPTVRTKGVLAPVGPASKHCMGFGYTMDVPWMHGIHW